MQNLPSSLKYGLRFGSANAVCGFGKIIQIYRIFGARSSKVFETVVGHLPENIANLLLFFEPSIEAEVTSKNG